MKKVLSYICFENAEAFEKWQIENPDTEVMQIQALTTKLLVDMKSSDNGCTADATTVIRTFVIYWKELS